MAGDDPMNGRMGLTYVTLAIALFSLASSVFQNWNYARNIESVQRNVLRAEHLRSCRDMIDLFFQFRLQAEQAHAAVLAGRAMETSPLRATVYKFGALSTFLANFLGDPARQRYTALSWELLALADTLPNLTDDQFQTRFGAIDKQFSTVNDECTRAAQSMLL